MFEQNTNIKLEIELLKVNYNILLFSNFSIDKTLKESLYEENSLLKVKSFLSFNIFEHNQHPENVIMNNNPEQKKMFKILQINLRKFKTMIQNNIGKEILLFKYFQTAIFEPFKIITYIAKKSCDLNGYDYKEIYDLIQNAVENILYFYRLNISFSTKDTLNVKSHLNSGDITYLNHYYELLDKKEISYVDMGEIIRSNEYVITLLVEHPKYKSMKKEICQSQMDILEKLFNLDYCDTQEIIVKCLLKKILNVQDLENNLNYEIETQTKYLNILKKFIAMDNSFDYLLLFYYKPVNGKLKRKISNYGKSLHYFLIYIYIYGYFQFYLYTRIYAGINTNNFFLESIVDSIKFIKQLCNGEWANEYTTFLFNKEFGKKSAQKFLFNDTNIENIDSYSLLDIIFFINTTILEIFMSNSHQDVHVFSNLYETNISLLFAIIKSNNSSCLKYFSPFETKKQNKFLMNLNNGKTSVFDTVARMNSHNRLNTLSSLGTNIFMEKFYFLDMFINCRKCLENPEIYSTDFVIQSTFDNFKLINSLLNANMSNKGIIFDFEIIFPPQLILNLMKHYYKILIQKYQISNDNDGEVSTIDKKEFKKFNIIYERNKELFNDKLFNLSCQFFIYIRILSDKFGNKDAVKLTELINLKSNKDMTELNSLRQNYFNLYLVRYIKPSKISILK